MSHTIIGVDVGGTKIHVGLVAPGGKILKRHRIATDTAGGKNAVLSNISDAIRSVWQKDVKAIGLGMAGLTDHKKGVYVYGPNFPKAFANVPLAAQLRSEFKKPVSLDNDVHCFTLAEAKFGSAKRFSSVVGVTLGTGIGGAIVLNGELVRGRNNAAGEFGHTTVSLSSVIPCSCGKKGHLEAYGSGSAMRALYKEASGRDVLPTEVENYAKKGDKLAKKVVNSMSEALSVGFANLIQTLNPDIIVVGGRISQVDILWNSVEKGVHNAVPYTLLKSTPLVRSKLGDDAMLLGAALITNKL